ncbi:hypothetical protein CMI37_37005 [Candidatus Pacearchaeota archaeon]|jgi:hypothetical protein|nr:hypothetical protein [Candidatus Pacearchaeota archaeon]
MNKSTELIPDLFASFKSEPDKYQHQLNEDIDITIYTSKDSFNVTNAKAQEKWKKVKTIMIFSATNLPDLEAGEIRCTINGSKLYMNKDVITDVIEMLKSKVENKFEN